MEELFFMIELFTLKIRGTVKKIIPNYGYGYIERKGAQDIKFKLENIIL